VSGSAASVALTTATGAALVTLDGNGGSRSEMAPIPPTLTPTEAIVLSGAQTTMRVNGAPPGRPVTLEAGVPGAPEHQTLARVTASAAGTAEFTVPVSVSGDYRAVSPAGSSPPSRVTAAVAPTSPPGVTAVPSGPGQVSMSWTPPLDTGGAPLTRFVVRVDGERQVLPPDALGLVVEDLVAGPHKVSVRAGNAVAVSDAAVAAVEVVPYPSVTGPKAARKGTTVALTVGGLLRGAPKAVTLTPAGAGRDARISRVRADGTATVRLVVRRTVTVTVSSADVVSAPHRVVVRRRR